MHFGTLQNYWEYRAALFVTPGAFSDRLTRGGPVVRTPGSWTLGRRASAATTGRSFSFDVERAVSKEATTDSYARDGGVTLNAGRRRTCS